MFSWPWQSKKSKDALYFGIVIGFILFITAFTRLWQLGSLPVGLTWDEAALGYIGKMVITTGMDEHFDRLPIAFKSFGDYKAPLAMYITGLFTTVLGMHAWVVRLPYALAGIASVALTMWMTWRLTNHKWYAILSGWFLAITPWHILFSRVGFESGLAMLCMLFVLTGWLEVRRKETKKLFKKVWWVLIVLSATASIYVYHSTKVVLPLTLGVIGVYEYFSQPKYWQKHWKTVTAAAIGLGVLLLPFALTLFNGTGVARASQTTIFAQYTFAQAIPKFFQNLMAYFSLDFLAMGKTDSLRHSTGSKGVLLWSELILLLLGLTFGIARPIERLAKRRKNTFQKFFHMLFPHKNDETLLTTPIWIWVTLLVIGILPAAIGVETPHANRALLALPPLIVLLVSGARELQKELQPKTFLTVLSIILIISMVEWGAFWNFYRTEYRNLSSTAWMEGYDEAVRTTHSYIADNKRTKFTNAYGEPEIFFAFYNQVPFHTYREFRIPGSVQFGPISTLDSENFDVLITPGDKPLEGMTAVKTISRSDGTPAFYVYETR